MTTLICAIQLGSSRIIAIAAQKDLQTGALNNIQIEIETSSGCIRHGRVVNVEQTAMHLRSLIQKLNNRTLATISSAYVGVGGFSLHSLMQQPSVQIPDYDVLSQQPIDNGQYQLILGRKQLCEGIRAAMNRANIAIIDFIAQPLATAQILTPEERQRGCVLVDMGAETTTVAIYHEGELRHLAVIPLGGQCVTNDIQASGCSPEDAERIKIDWSDVTREFTTEPDRANPISTLLGDKTLPIPQSRLNSVALCRYEELAANIQHQIDCSGLASKLECGCIVTGGVSLQRGLVSLLSRRLGISRIEVRAYREPSLLGSERKPHLSNALGLLTFCSRSCVAPAPKPVETPAPAPVQTPPPTKKEQDNEPSLFTNIDEEETFASGHSFRDNILRFAKDLFTGQN